MENMTNTKQINYRTCIGYFIIGYFGIVQGAPFGALNEDCTADAVVATFLLDGTTHVKPEQLQHMFSIVTDIAETLPEGSVGSAVFVSEIDEEILTFQAPVPTSDFTKTLETAKQHVAKGGKIYSEAIQNEVEKRFTVSDYKTKAEIVYLFVTDLTSFGNFPFILWKKKVYVIVLGTGVSYELNDLASSRLHVHVISGPDDIRNVSDLVTRQTCIDSHLKCDVDKFMEKRSIKCDSCMYVCSNVTQTQSEACGENCPYVRIPPKELAVKDQQIPDSSADVLVTNGVSNRARRTALIAVFSVLGIVVFAGVYIGMYMTCRQKRLACYKGEPTGNCVQETARPGEEGGNSDEALLNESTGGARCEEAASGFSIHFKNDKELNMNGEVFNRPDFQDVH